jgi:ankyrin repeat protein
MYKENDKVIGLHGSIKNQIGVVVTILENNYYNVIWGGTNKKKRYKHSSIAIYKENLLNNEENPNNIKEKSADNNVNNSSLSPFSSSSSSSSTTTNNVDNKVNNRDDMNQNQNNSLSNISNSMNLSGLNINKSNNNKLDLILGKYSQPQEEDGDDLYTINTFTEKSDDDLFQDFLKAAEKGGVGGIVFISNMLKYDSRAKEFINRKHDGEEYTALMWASKNGHLDVVQLLLASDADVNIQGGWNECTALMKACEKGKFEVVEALIKAGAEVNLLNSDHYTALMLASFKINSTDGIKIIELLCENDAEVNAYDKDEWTALIYAVEFGRFEIVKCLLEYRADVLHENKYGKSSIMMACEKGNLDILKLLYNGKDSTALNGRSKIGKSILLIACIKENNIDVIKYLVENGAKIDPGPFINQENKLEIIDTPLLMACEQGYIDVVGYLVEQEARKDATNEDGHNSLMKACSGKNSKKASALVKLLLNDNIDTDISPFVDKKNGDTCLMLACRKGHVDVIILLLNHVFKNNPNNLRVLSTLPYFNAVNKNGEDATSILCNFFSTNEKAEIILLKFIKNAICPDLSLNINEYPIYLLELFPYILRNMTNPSSIFNSKLSDSIFDGLKELYIGLDHGKLKDSYFFSSLINILWALKWAAATHPLEKRDLDERYDDIDRMVNSIFKSDCLDKIENICSLFLNSITNFDEKDDNANNNQYSIIKHAQTFTTGPLQKCIDYGLIKCLGTSQVSWYVEKMFDTSLRTIDVRSIRNWEDLFQIRSQCQNLRYCPKTMFLLESLSKITLLSNLFYVSSYLYNVDDIIQMNKDALVFKCIWTKAYSALPTCVWHKSEYFLVIMLFTTILYECGEIKLTYHYLSKNKTNNYNGSKQHTYFDILSRNIFESDTLFREYSKVIFNHFCKDTWNILDFITMLCLVGWFVCRSFDNIDLARSCLAFAAIPLSLNLLRLLTLFEDAGCLVFTIFEMTKDLKTFAIVFFTAIFGFIVAFHSLFQVANHSEDDFNNFFYFEKPEESRSLEYDAYNKLYQKFGTLNKTFRTMFDAALGQYGTESFAKHIHVDLATSLTSLYALFAMVILLNLVVAKMGATYDNIHVGAFSTWCAMNAKNVKDFLLIYERNSLCMLPPPFNAVSTIVSLFAKDKEVSTAGTVSDSLLCLLSSPFYSICEIFYAYDHLLNSKSIDKKYRNGITIGTILFFPVWFCISWILIIWNVLNNLNFLNGRYIKIDSETNRIDYSEENNKRVTFGLNKTFIEFLFMAFSICYISILDNLLVDYYVLQSIVVTVLYFNCCWCVINFYPINDYHIFPIVSESKSIDENILSSNSNVFQKTETFLKIVALITYIIWQHFRKPILYSIIIIAMLSSYFHIFRKIKEETKFETVQNHTNNVSCNPKIPGTGTFNFKVVRGSFSNLPASNIGREHNLLIRISYDDQVHCIKSLPPAKLPKLEFHDDWIFRFFSDQKFEKEIEIDVFDLEDNFSDNKDNVYENSIKILSKTENIQRWLANGKYQNDVYLNDENNEKTESFIQIYLSDITFELEKQLGLSLTRRVSLLSSNDLDVAVESIPEQLPKINRQVSGGSICEKVFTNQDRDRIFDSYHKKP